MKKFNFIICALMTSLIMSCSSNNNSGNTVSLYDLKSETEKTYEEDSIAKWIVDNFNKFHAYSSNDSVDFSLNSENMIKFIEEVYPYIQKFYKENMEYYNTYENIESYAGTDGKNWLFYDKYRANGRICYFYYNSNDGICDFSNKDNYVDSWMHLVEVNIYDEIDRKVPTPTELDDVIFNEGTWFLKFEEYKNHKLIKIHVPKEEYSKEAIFDENDNKVKYIVS